VNLEQLYLKDMLAFVIIIIIINFAFFSQTVSFIIKIDHTKIVEHAILHKKCSYIFFLRITISEI
jgi:hypothetical protein